MTVLEGTYTGFFTLPGDRSRTFTIEHSGPEPYTKTVASVTSFVASALEKIPPGARVRVLVEELDSPAPVA